MTISFIRFLQLEGCHEIIESINHNQPFVFIPYSILEKYTNVSYEILCELEQQLKCKIIPTTNLNIISMQKPLYREISSIISSLQPIKPYPISYYFKCSECEQTYSFPILNPLSVKIADIYKCENPNCIQSYSHPIVPTIEYGDIIQFSMRIDDVSCICYYRGFSSDYNRFLHAISINAPIKVYGFIQGDKRSHKYYLHVIYYEILHPIECSEQIYMFHTQFIPNNEKQMIFSNFFTNYAFMQQYLDFETYELREGFPDLIVYKQNQPKYIEFEYDVANFYNHKHHLSEKKADYVIAWKNSSSRSDHYFQIILLPSLDGSIITNSNKIRLQGEKGFDLLYSYVAFLFSHRTQRSLFPIVLHLISFSSILDSVLQIHLINFKITNWNKDDEKSYKLLLKTFGINSNSKILLNSENSADIVIKYELEEQQDLLQTNILDEISSLKEYYYFYLRIGNNMVSFSNNLFSQVYNICDENTPDRLEYSNLLCLLASCINSFKQKKNMVLNDILNINSNLHKLLNIQIIYN